MIKRVFATFGVTSLIPFVQLYKIVTIKVFLFDYFCEFLSGDDKGDAIKSGR